jgi:hypothetical protein
MPQQDMYSTCSTQKAHKQACRMPCWQLASLKPLRALSQFNASKALCIYMSHICILQSLQR